MPIVALLFGGLGKALAAALAWLRTIPWYVLVIAALVITLGLVQLSKGRDIAAGDARLAHDQGLFATWRQVESTNMATIRQYQAVTLEQNQALQTYAGRMAELTRLADKARAAAAQAAVGRDRAIALLHAAPAVQNDCKAPPVHDQVRSQL